MMFTVERTDRMLEVRARERSQLEHIQVIMERTFSSLLVSDEPLPSTKGGTAEAVPTDASGRPVVGSPKGDSAKDASAAGADTDKAKDEADKGTASERPGTRPPPFPRVILSPDTNAASLAALSMSSRVLSRGSTGSGTDMSVYENFLPQRLEVVLHRSPMPQATVDPMTLPLPPRKLRRKAKEAESKSGSEERSEAAADTASDDVPEEEDELTMPARAVRGAFEMHPQPPKGWRPPGLATSPADWNTDFATSGLWELWWIPLLPPGSEDQPVTVREAMFTGLGRPQMVASDLRFVRWTVFIKRQHQETLISTWSSDLPAYIEVQAETSSGMTANWMFEVDYAAGPEMARKPDTAKPRGTDASKTGDRTGDRPEVKTDRVRSGLARPPKVPKNGGDGK